MSLREWNLSDYPLDLCNENESVKMMRLPDTSRVVRQHLELAETNLQ